MEPSIQKICKYLDSNKITYILGDKESELIIKHQLGTYDIAIRSRIPENFPCGLPSFHLVDREKFGGLAHVGWGELCEAEICYGKDNNLNTDYNDPGKVFCEALNRALKILYKSLNNKSRHSAYPLPISRI